MRLDLKGDDDTTGDKKAFNNPTKTTQTEFDVLFPYDRIYPEQHQYLKCIKRALHKNGHALIEAPPGTNQSLCLLSSLTSYQQQQQQQNESTATSTQNSIPPRRIVYATNSVPETNKVMVELAVVMEYRQQQYKAQQQQQQQQHQQPQSSDSNSNNKNHKSKNKSRPLPHRVLFENVKDGFWKSSSTATAAVSGADQSIQNYNVHHASNTNESYSASSSTSKSLPFLALCLTGSDRNAVDEACRIAHDHDHDHDHDHVATMMTDCDNPPPNGIFASLQQLHDWAQFSSSNSSSKDNKPPLWSSWQHLMKYTIQHANVLVVTYPYLLDPMTAMMIGSAIYDKTTAVTTTGGSNNLNNNNNNTNNSNKENDTSNTSTSKDITTTTTTTTTNQTTATKKKKEEEDNDNNGKSDAIVVFDHAHNVDAACMDALSATVNLQDLEQATRSLDKLSSEILRFKLLQQQRCNHANNSNSNGSNTNGTSNNKQNNDIPVPLKDEYETLVQHPIDDGMYRPILFPSDDVVHEPVPGNIRHMKHFIGCMKKIIEHFKVRLRWATEHSKPQHSVQTTEKSKQSNHGQHVSKKKKTGSGSVSPLAFLHQMMNATALDSKTLRFVHSRVLSMLRTLNVSHLESFAGLINVAYLASLLGFTKTKESSKFAIVLEQTSVVIGHHGTNQPSSQNNNGNGATIGGGAGGNMNGSYNLGGGGADEGRKTEYVMMLQVVCLDPSLAIKPIFDRFNTVILTSSTLSPLHYYPKILQFEPVVAESIPMTTIRPCINPIMISRGSDQLGMSTSYKERFTMGCIRNYGKMLVDLVSTIPDGVVVYFPSYNYMEALICEWDATGIMREMTEWKLVFVETKDNLELNAIALDNYRASCDIGRGGVFFSVARGSISEAVPFDLHYGRALVMIGIPYEYTLSKVVKARLEYIQTHFDIREQDYLTFDAVRQVSKCFGRVIRSKTDYGVLIFADNRFHRNDKRAKLPGWVTQFMSDNQQDLTTDSAVAQIKRFLRQTGQPVDQNLLQNVLTHE